VKSEGSVTVTVSEGLTSTSLLDFAIYLLSHGLFWEKLRHVT